jgi:hypothetical protein
MDTYLYRFRPLKYLLGEEYQELSRQTIYFASVAQLNDPMEGFKDVFWDGDLIAWRNLARHYILCLSHAVFQYCVLQEAHPMSWDLIPLHDSRPEGLTEPERQMLDAVLAEVFARSAFTHYVERIADRIHPVRQNELEFHLRNIQSLAVPCIARVLCNRNLQPSIHGATDVIEAAEVKLTSATESTRLINVVEREHPGQEHATEQVYAALNRSTVQMTLIEHHNGRLDKRQANRNFVLLDFPTGYVRNVERLVYPVWYAACFTKDCHNSAVWGTYGESHQGVCLKFKVKATEGRPTLNLNRVCGWSAPGGPVRGNVQDPLHQVEYQSKFVSIDFFRSLGGISAPILNRDWHYSEDGHPSVCATAGHFTDEKRQVFWREFERSTTTKLIDWAYEEEYRLIQYGLSEDYSDPMLRTAEYEFEDLEGIIFGINTKEEDKLSIMKIIDDKCLEHQRSDFKFYQAYYSPATGSIEVAELGLLKISTTSTQDASVSL